MADKKKDSSRDSFENPMLVNIDDENIEMLSGPSEFMIGYYDAEEEIIYVDEDYEKEIIDKLEAKIDDDGVWNFTVTTKSDDDPDKKEKKQRKGKKRRPTTYDPKKHPKKGSIRMFKERECKDILVKYSCQVVRNRVPPAYVSANYFQGVCKKSPRHLCFETFGLKIKLPLYGDKACTQRIGTVRVLGWNCLET